MTTIEVDARGRTALGKIARPGPYRVTEQANGALLLEPARLLTEAEIAVLGNAHVSAAIKATFDGTAETVKPENWRD